MALVDRTRSGYLRQHRNRRWAQRKDPEHLSRPRDDRDRPRPLRAPDAPAARSRRGRCWTPIWTGPRI